MAQVAPTRVAEPARSAVILCAGIGERLRPLTLDRPKCMVDVGGKPLIARTTAALRSHGFGRLYVNLHHMPDVMMDYLGDGSKFGVEVRYSYESSLLGSAGGTKQFERFLPQTFLVAYGDVLTNADIERLWHSQALAQADATLLVHRSERPWECGVVEFDGNGSVTSLVEKPPREAVTSDWVNSGMFVLDRSVLDLVAPGENSDFAFDVFPAMLEAGRSIMAVPLVQDEYVIDIGTLSGLESARDRVSR
jgi:NDP-sugar pyrophosphorylase family protein